MDIIANNITSNKLEAQNVTINNKDVYQWFSERISDFVEVTSTVNKMGDKIVDISSQVSSIDVVVDELTTKVETQSSAISDIISSSVILSDGLTGITDAITTISGNISSISGDVLSNSQAISTIKADVKTISSNLTDLTTEFNNLTSNIQLVNEQLDNYLYIDPVQIYQNSADCTDNSNGWFIGFTPEFLGIQPGGYISKLHIRSRTSSSASKFNVSFRLDWWISAGNEATIDRSTTTLNITEANTVYSFDFAGKAPIVSADQYIYRFVPTFGGQSNAQIGIAMQDGDSTQLTLGNLSSSNKIPAISVEFYNPVNENDTSLKLFKKFFKILQ